MAFSSWKACAVAALLAAACSPEPGGGSGGAGTGGAAGAGGAGGAGTGGTGGTGGAGGAGAGGGASSTASGGGGAGGEAGYACASLGDPCSTCLSLRCQDSFCTCQENPECAALANCFLICAAGDEPCQQTCLTAHAAGISDSFLEGGCASELCSAQCPSRVPLSACDSCRFAGCAAEMNACVANPSCRALLACADACEAGDAGCAEECAMLYEDGAPAAQAVSDCQGAQCGAACEDR
ncbi:hypothetical protein WMF37_02515 [Sorangium sp. So ce291]|uniref:hypothetical protein n=1 Tax=Sorangium sp. So ce291 TaxID=3133294 RepID=UPI003F62ED90